MILNKRSEKLMKILLNSTKTENTCLDNYFKKELLKSVNKNCRNNDYYALDKYGLVIRRSHQNNIKSCYGWTYLNDYTKEPISIHIDPKLIIMKSERINEITLEKLKSKFTKEFSDRSIYARVYKEIGRSL